MYLITDNKTFNISCMIIILVEENEENHPKKVKHVANTAK